MSNSTIWTKEQEAGITTVGHHVLVSAAAGSGKTAVLAERCAHLVCNAEGRCDVTSLLVVTFTRAAAAEMRERIEKALRQRLSAATEPAAVERLRRQTQLLGNASIGTLHSFCIDLLREHFQLVGLDPAFTILDQDQSVLLRRQIAEQLFAEHYDREDGDAFRQFVDDYGKRDDDDLMGRVLSTQALLESVVDPQAWLAEARRRLTDAASRPLKESTLGKQFLAELSTHLDEIAGLCDAAEATLARFDSMKAYRPYLAQLRAIVDHMRNLLAGPGYTALAAAVLQELPPIPRVANGLPGKEECKGIIDQLRKAMGVDGTLACWCRFREREWRDGISRTIEPTNVFLNLVVEFGERFTTAKCEQRALDFGDLERMTLRLLDDLGEPSEVARMCRRRYAHVLVDEYQDINEVQERILQSLSRDGRLHAGNLFCVGDVKQSIYRFRLAQPENFRAREERFGRDQPRNGGQVIDLRTNFRSRGAILDCLNALFEKMMTGESMEITYDETHRLNTPEQSMYDCLPCGDPPVDLHLLTDESDSDDTKAEREGAFVASQIRKLIDDQTQIVDRATGLTRKLRYGDIAVLLRSLRGKAADFATGLRTAGIPVYSDSNSGFFETQEVRDLLALAAVLDNAQQDVPLAAVLRSPLLRLEHAEDEMAAARLAYPSDEIPFHSAIARFSAQIDGDLRAAMQTLERWRILVNQRPLHDALQTILRDSGYLAFVAALNDGEQRVANVRAFLERVRRFCEATQRQDLSRFRQFMEALASDLDAGQPSVAAAGGDAVRIMTVHRAKGLEFAVVFVPDLGKKHSMQSTAGSILVDRKGFVGMAVVDSELRVQYPSLPQLIAKSAIRRQILAEELRVLYVAATRACERLILVGSCSCKNREEWRNRFSGHVGALPGNVMLSANTPLQWLAAASYAVAASLPDLLTIHEPQEPPSTEPLRREKPTPLQEQLIDGRPLEGHFRSTLADQVIHRLGRTYRFEEESKLFAVRSVTQLANAGHKPHIPRRLARFPAEESIGAELRDLSATEIGDATHLAMEHLDLGAVVDCASVQRQLHAMVKKSLLSQQQMDSVKVEELCWFLESDLGRLMRENAPAVRRERTIYFPLQDTGEPLDRTMVRGRIDVLLALSDRCVIIDYKTDRMPPALLDTQVDHHRAQLKLYADALEKIVAKPVQAYLAFLKARQNRIVIE